MGKWIKIGLGALVAVVIVVAVLVIFVLSNLDEIVVAVVERVGSRVTGTAVTLDGAEISLRDSAGSLSGLRIANPPGFETPLAIELGLVGLDLDLASLASEEVVLRQVVVDGPHVTYEYLDEKDNLQTLLANVEAAEESPTAEEQAEDGGDIRLVIEEFRLTGTRVTIVHERLEEDLTLQIQDIILHDIGRVGAGATAASAAKQVLEPLIERTLEAARDHATELLKSQAAEEIESRAREKLGGLLGGGD